MDKQRSAIGQFVRNERKKKRMSQTELSEQMGVSRSWVAMMESGKMPNPRLSTIHKIATALGREPADIVSVIHGKIIGCEMCGYAHAEIQCPACGHWRN